MSTIKTICLMVMSMFIGAVICYSTFLSKDIQAENVMESSEETADIIDEVTDIDKQVEADKAGFIYPKNQLDNPAIIFVPNDEVLRSFPKKVVYGVYCALTEGLGTDASNFFVSTWEKDDYDVYTIGIGFNSGASVDLQVDASSGAYKYDKTKEEIESDERVREIRGEPIYTFTEAQIDEYASYVTDYTGIVNPELQSVKERNCCYIIWYNDYGTDRFIRLSKSDMHMTKRGHYDALKGEYVVDWEEDSQQQSKEE